jgi:hypothetical protein
MSRRATARNLAASVRARLKQHADAAKEDFNLTLTHYGLLQRSNPPPSNLHIHPQPLTRSR